MSEQEYKDKYEQQDLEILIKCEQYYLYRM